MDGLVLRMRILGFFHCRWVVSNEYDHEGWPIGKFWILMLGGEVWGWTTIIEFSSECTLLTCLYGQGIVLQWRRNVPIRGHLLEVG